MKASRITRRSFFQRVAGGTVGAGALLTLTGCVGFSDSDPYDPIGGGRGGQRRGYSDSDPVDPYGQGAGGCTDSDRGRHADPLGQGRSCRQVYTDNDSGRNSDAVGCGGGRCGPQGGHTDNDRGRNADPIGQGRRRRR